MDSMADEITVRADVKDKRRGSAAEEGSAWVGGERIQSETEVRAWRLSTAADIDPGESGIDTDIKQPSESDSQTAPLFSLKTYLRRSSSTASATTDSLSSSQQSNTGVDCAGIILNCLYCRFYDIIHMLPDCCKPVANLCCPDYKQVNAATDASSSSDDDSYVDLDCGLLACCDDAGDCLELAMEVSELCYH